MHVRSTIRTLAFLSVALLLAILAPPLARAGNAPPMSGTAAAATAQSPRVLAFYYAWFDQNTWSSNLTSDSPTQPYASSDPATIVRHIQQARSGGIDAFVVSWLGANNPTDVNFKAMLNAAQSANFAATIDFETEQYGTREQVIGALAYVRDALTPHPAFLRRGSQPVLFFWREQKFSVSDWAQIRSAVDPNHQQVWIAEGVDVSYQNVFDGHHLYSIAWSPDVNHTLGDWSGRVRRAGADKLWVATVMPGYDDTRTSRADRFARARDNGNFYRSTWQAAIATNPDWVIITSFNEWIEGTMIEPSATYGNLYLDLTREFSAQFKAGAEPAASIPAAITSAVKTSTPKPNQYLTTDILRVRSGPGFEYEILGRLPANRALQILGRSADGEWLELAYPNSNSRGWVKAEFVAPRTGLAAFPIAAAPPPTPTFAPTPVPTLAPTLDESQFNDFSWVPPWY